MQILKRGIPSGYVPKRTMYEFTCPDCKSKLKASEYELEYSYISDFSFKCPVCAARRHISREEIKKVDNCG